LGSVPQDSYVVPYVDTLSTPGGELNTNKMMKSQFTMPELQDNKLIEWKLYVTKDLGNYDMIIGRDVLQFLGINIQFSTQEVVWECLHAIPGLRCHGHGLLPH
jgi:hypothetical protein